MKARLRDLLGFAQLSAKALAGFPRETLGPAASVPPASDPRTQFGVVPLGDDVGPVPALPPPTLHEPATPKPVWPLLHKPARSDANPANPPASETEARSSPSSSLPRPTTLRSAIEKVAMDSIISPALRRPADEPAAAADAFVPPPSVPGWPTLGMPRPAEPAAGEDEFPMVAPPPATPRPSLTLVRPVFDDPEFTATPAPKSEPVAPGAKSPGASPPVSPGPHAKQPGARAGAPAPKIVPLPPPLAHVASPEPTAEYEPEEFESLATDTPPAKVDPKAFARATEDFMRSSPVLGATGRRVQRDVDDLGFGDPDAIAVGTMVQDMTRMGIPPERQPEVRARLLDLARRLERAELEWNALRKAVWFAMEYPELARRLMPVLLPWIDRAA